MDALALTILAVASILAILWDDAITAFLHWGRW